MSGSQPKAPGFAGGYLLGTFHHVGEQHLQRYVTEFDFRYSNRASLGIDDAERTDKALKGIGGKRLTYRRTGT